jgi:hypothetical protein
MLDTLAPAATQDALAFAFFDSHFFVDSNIHHSSRNYIYSKLHRDGNVVFWSWYINPEQRLNIDCVNSNDSYI